MYSLNYLKELIGPLTFRGLEQVMRKDASVNKCDADTYLKENYVAYLSCSATWLTLFPSKPLQVRMFDLMKEYGLIRMISYAKEADIAILKGLEVPADNPFSTVIPLVLRYLANIERSNDIVYLNNIVEDPRLFKRLHQVLVYPSRFSAPYMPFLDMKTLESFKSEQKRLSRHDRAKVDQKESPRINGGYIYWGTKVRDVIKDILPWDEICSKVKSLLQDPDLNLNPGACYMTGSRAGNKISYLASTHPELFMSIFGDSATRACVPQEPVEGRSQGYIVPKSAETKRFIAAEEPYRQLICLGVFRILDRYLDEIGIDLHDQEEQRRLCRYAGATGEYATTDVSSASDGITHVLFSDLFPPEFVELVEPYMGTSVQVTVNGKTYTIDLSSRITMGNGMTFALECIVFWAVDYVCMETYELYTGTRLNRYIGDVLTLDYLILPGIYGDDQVHHSVVSETVYDCLTALGFKVNTSKSYSGSDAFREACGVEYLHDWDVTPVRFPRKTIRGTFDMKTLRLDSSARRDSRSDSYYDSTMTLISLQKQLIEKNLFDAAEVVTTIIGVANPNMTFSRIGEDCCDLWGNTIKRKQMGERAYTALSQFAIMSNNKRVILPDCDEVASLNAILTRFESAAGYVPDCLYVEEKDHPALFNILVSKRHADFSLHTFTTRYSKSIELDGVEVEDTSTKTTIDRFVKVMVVHKSTFATYKTVPYEFDLHLTPVVEFTIKQEEAQRIRNDIILNAILDQWVYTTFLKYGPSYEHDAETLEGVIERSAGITSPRFPGYDTRSKDMFYRRLFGAPEIIWKEKADR